MTRSLLAGFFAAIGLFASPALAVDRNVRDCGAVGDGRALETAAINRAVTEVAAAGGGTVFVPAGHYRTGTIQLQSNVVLELGAGAVLVGSTDLADYPLQPPPTPDDTPEFRRRRHTFPDKLEYGRYSLICARDADNVRVVGAGVIDGSGDAPTFSKAEMRKAGLSREEAHARRPFGLSFIHCTNVQVKGITLRNLASWTQDYLDCDGVLVDGVRVDSRHDDRNNDGIDLDGSRNVRVVNCWFNAGDDAICLKSSYRACENIVIANSVCSSLANGLKFGTASMAGFRNISATNLVMEQVSCAGIALEAVDGGVIDGVTISNIAMHEVGAAIFLRLGDRGRTWMRPDDRVVGALRNVTIENVTARIFTPRDGRPLASSISGLAGHPVENIRVRGVRLILGREYGASALKEWVPPVVPEAETDYPEYAMFGALPASAFFVRHARGVQLDDIEVSAAAGPDLRSALVADEVEALHASGWRVASTADSAPLALLRNVHAAEIRGWAAPGATSSLVRVEGPDSSVTLFDCNLAPFAAPVSLAPGVPATAVRESGGVR